MYIDMNYPHEMLSFIFSKENQNVCYCHFNLHLKGSHLDEKTSGLTFLLTDIYWVLILNSQPVGV